MAGATALLYCLPWLFSRTTRCKRQDFVDTALQGGEAWQFWLQTKSGCRHMHQETCSGRQKLCLSFQGPKLFAG